MKIDVKYYERLRDYPTHEELYSELVSFLNAYSDNPTDSYLEALYELSLRKENIDFLVDDITLERISKSVQLAWDINSLPNTELVIMLIFNFELENAFKMLKNKYSSVSQEAIKRELEECFDDAKYGPPPLKFW